MKTLEQVKMDYVKEVLTQYNRTEAAKILGISYKTTYNLAKKLGIEETKIALARQETIKRIKSPFPTNEERIDYKDNPERKSR